MTDLLSRIKEYEGLKSEITASVNEALESYTTLTKQSLPTPFVVVDYFLDMDELHVIIEISMEWRDIQDDIFIPIGFLEDQGAFMEILAKSKVIKEALRETEEAEERKRINKEEETLFLSLYERHKGAIPT